MYIIPLKLPGVLCAERKVSELWDVTSSCKRGCWEKSTNIFVRERVGRDKHDVELHFAK